MDYDKKTEVALWRFSVMGPLVNAHREHGDVRRLCEEAASKIYEREDGRQVRVKARTIEAWYYRYRTGGGLRALRPEGRSDAGSESGDPSRASRAVLALKREKMRRSVRMIIRTLERAGGPVGAS